MSSRLKVPHTHHARHDGTTARSDGTRGRPRAVVIGGGIAGLATAALLARDGLSVDLLEQHDELGGRVGSWAHRGFRFDTGASWYLMPEVFDHFFRLLGTTTAEQLELSLLEPGYRVFFQGQQAPVDVGPDRSANMAIFEAIEPGAGQRLGDYLTSAADAYRIAIRHFLYTNFTSGAALLHPDILRRLPQLIRLLTRSLEDHVAGHFTDRRLRQILGYPAVFLGSSPARTPSMYHLMSWLDLADGVRYPQGGFSRLIDVIARLAVREGARLHTGCAVSAVRTRPRSGRRTGAVVDGVAYRAPDGSERTMPADLIVGAADMHHVETSLLPPAMRTYPPRWWERRDPGPGAVLLMLGIRGRVPELTHHSLLFADDWGSQFADIAARRPRAPAPASLYVCKPSETDPSVAPPGCDNLFVLVPVPAVVSLGRGGIDGAGDPAIEAIADTAINQIADWARIPDLAERIMVRRTVGPADFADEFNAWCGGALGPAHTLRQSAFLRARNASSKVTGLYYAGASTVPGIGLPMCLISAELVLKHLRHDRSAGPTKVLQ